MDLDENEDEKCIYIIHYQWLGKNVIAFGTHDVVHRLLNTT